MIFYLITTWLLLIPSSIGVDMVTEEDFNKFKNEIFYRLGQMDGKLAQIRETTVTAIPGLPGPPGINGMVGPRGAKGERGERGSCDCESRKGGEWSETTEKPKDSAGPVGPPISSAMQDLMSRMMAAKPPTNGATIYYKDSSGSPSNPKSNFKIWSSSPSNVSLSPFSKWIIPMQPVKLFPDKPQEKELLEDSKEEEAEPNKKFTETFSDQHSSSSSNSSSSTYTKTTN